jgi:hypothetical protein
VGFDPTYEPPQGIAVTDTSPRRGQGIHHAVPDPYGDPKAISWVIARTCYHGCPMNAVDHLTIDLADPEDIRKKLPQARELFAAKQRELLELNKQVEHWAALVNHLAGVVGEPGGERSRGIRAYGGGPSFELRANRKKRAPSQQKAIDALQQFGRPTGPSALYRFMVSEQLSAPANANALGASLYGAQKAGRIQKTPDGLYAPLDWQPEQDRLTENGSGQPLSAAVPNQGVA